MECEGNALWPMSRTPVAIDLPSSTVKQLVSGYLTEDLQRHA
jgi:hypothetical protein